MRILIKYATRGRVEKFRSAIKNIKDTIHTENYLIVVSVDADDTLMIQESITMIDKSIVFHIGPAHGKVAAINRDINNMYENWDLLINFSDDMRFIVNGWDEIMIKRIKTIWGESLDFFAHFSDGYVFEKLPTMSIIGREYYERFYYIYPPCYKSVSCDAEAMYVSMMLGKHHYFTDGLFKHEHYVNVKGAKIDEVYKKNNTYESHDTKVYFERLNKNFYVNNPGPTPFDQFKTKK
jgi:hypothetical protein